MFSKELVEAVRRFHSSGSFHQRGPATMRSVYKRSDDGKKSGLASNRRAMVAAVRRGVSMRAVAREFDMSLSTVQWWTTRAAGRRLDRVDWGTRPPVPHHVHRTEPMVEDAIVRARRELQTHSPLGEYGATAIRTLLVRRGDQVPAVRTIARVLQRRGLLDAVHRIRRPAPPRGWYLPEVAAGKAELDSFDIIEGLVIRGPLEVEVLTGVSLHGGLPAAWPGPPVTARAAVVHLIEHWRRFGCPQYAQFDNDTRFHGPHHHPDVISRVMRLCVSLAITPVFTPVQEMGFQAGIENLNGRWQTYVWGRFMHRGYRDLQTRSEQYLSAYRDRAATRIDAAPPRRPFPNRWHLDLQQRPQGQIIFLRRTTDAGRVSLLGHVFDVNPLWPHRLVRCEVDLPRERIRFYALRRRAPDEHPLLTEKPYRLPNRIFLE